jgi:methyl coenzyme M reductase subunit D
MSKLINISDNYKTVIKYIHQGDVISDEIFVATFNNISYTVQFKLPFRYDLKNGLFIQKPVIYNISKSDGSQLFDKDTQDITALLLSYLDEQQQLIDRIEFDQEEDEEEQDDYETKYDIWLNGRGNEGY